MRAKVELYLRLCSRWPYGDNRAILCKELQHIGFWHSCLLCAQIVHTLYNRRACKGCRRVLPVLLHHLLYSLYALFALFGEREESLLIHTVLLVDALQQLIWGYAHSCAPSCALCKEGAGNNRILVSNKFAGVKSITLLAAANKGSLALILSYNLSNIFKAGKHIIHLHSIIFCHCSKQFCGNNGLYHIGLIGELSKLFPALQEVVGENSGGLVAVKQHNLAIVVAQRNAYPVRIRVCCHNHICAHLICAGNSHLQS